MAKTFNDIEHRVNFAAFYKSTVTTFRCYRNKFSLIHLNIRSITNKFDSFKELLKSLDTKFKIIGLTETWLKDYDEVDFELVNYDYIGFNRTNKFKKLEALVCMLKNVTV